MPLPVYERGFLMCEMMARGRQELHAQPRLEAARPGVNLPVGLQSCCDK